MRFKQSIVAAFAAVAGVAISVGVPAFKAQAATTVVTLPITQYSHMLVDPAHHHLFITSGSGSSRILVTDYSGQTVATIPNEPGATGLALSSDGSTAYAALSHRDGSSAPMLPATGGGELVAGEPGQSPVQLASYDVSSGTATVLAPEEYLYEAANLRSMQITPDGKDVVLASGAPYYQEVYRVSDLSADGTYPTTNYPTSVSIAGDGTVAAGT